MVFWLLPTRAFCPSARGKKGSCDKGCLGSVLYSVGSFSFAHLGKEGIKRMNILYIKYGLIALGAIVAILTFVSAYKTLGPPTFIDYAVYHLIFE